MGANSEVAGYRYLLNLLMLIALQRSRARSSSKKGPGIAEGSRAFKPWAFADGPCPGGRGGEGGFGCLYDSRLLQMRLYCVMRMICTFPKD